MHVFVESNWVFQVLAPKHRRVPAATKLLERASSGELELLVPHIALKEGIRSIRRKRQRKDDDLKEYRRWAVAQNLFSEKVGEVVAEFIERYVEHVTDSLRTLETEAAELERIPNLRVFALTEAMVDLVLSLKYDPEVGRMKPIDEAILGAVLGMADQVRSADPSARIYFCTTDADLRPVTRDGRSRASLKQLYDERSITVLSDFSVP